MLPRFTTQTAPFNRKVIETGTGGAGSEESESTQTAPFNRKVIETISPRTAGASCLSSNSTL